MGASEGSGGGYTYSLASGTLPSGVSLSASGAISGTPALGTDGPYPITVEATDTSVPPVTGTMSFTINVGKGLFAGAGTVITTLVSQATGSATTWTGSFTETGGTGNITYSVTSGNLPTGLTVNPDGSVSGQAATSGNVTIVVKATDANNVTGSVSVALTIT
jgi:hypothetical protein